MSRSDTSAFNAQVVLEILKEEKTLSQSASAYDIHPSLVRNWRALALNGLPSIFEQRDTRAATEAAHAQQVEGVYAEIGRRTTQVNWLKKVGELRHLLHPPPSARPSARLRTWVDFWAGGTMANPA